MEVYLHGFGIRTKNLAQIVGKIFRQLVKDSCRRHVAKTVAARQTGKIQKIIFIDNRLKFDAARKFRPQSNASAIAAENIIAALSGAVPPSLVAF